MVNNLRSPVVDNYHGTMVADPYRWLEDPASQDTRDWITAHNEVSSAFLGAWPGRQKIKARLTELWNYPRYFLPVKAGGRYFFQKNDGLQNQAVLYVRETLGGEPAAVLDPNTLSQDGTVALTGYSPCRQGRLLAYSTSQSGSDWQEIRILDLKSNQHLPEVLRHCKFTAMSWAPDNLGFYYTRFPDPATVAPEEQSYNSKVYLHLVGTPQDQDQLIFARPDFKELGFHAKVSDDKRYLIITVWHGTDTENRVYYLDLTGTGEVIRLLDQADAMYNYVGNVGSLFYFHTNLDAPKGRVITIDLNNSNRSAWQEVIAEQGEALDTALMAGDRLVLTYLNHAQHIVKIYALSGEYMVDLALPGIGTVVGPVGKTGDDELFLSFTSYLDPATVLRYDLPSGSLTPWHEVLLSFSPGEYETVQRFCTSPDGTSIPVFLSYRRGLAQDGDNPTILYGYGGFNVSLTPAFSAAQIAWMEQGGIYAVACLRGGSEYGEDWHRAGMLDKKQNVFDDFIAAAQWLVKEKYTRVNRLAIMGGSNGGLLVAACMLQRPDAFGAVICRVPVIDMLRYHKFTVGRYWTGEYGNAEIYPEHFSFLYAYSPLHNVRAGVDYPATLILTADTDDRVVPAHALKFAATLEEHYSGSNPIITRIETKAGHGAGKPTGKLIEETADIYSFLGQVLARG
ncbi:MAG TPA: prolyl oligopeptidase family serine peptidase [Bacillota bacterium]|nr:prolyl oligopeptidase family serine peptidase [Bacillota bacterium]